MWHIHWSAFTHAPTIKYKILLISYHFWYPFEPISWTQLDPFYYCIEESFQSLLDLFVYSMIVTLCYLRCFILCLTYVIGFDYFWNFAWLSLYLTLRSLWILRFQARVFYFDNSWHGFPLLWMKIYFHAIMLLF